MWLGTGSWGQLPVERLETWTGRWMRGPLPGKAGCCLHCSRCELGRSDLCPGCFVEAAYGGNSGAEGPAVQVELQHGWGGPGRDGWGPAHTASQDDKGDLKCSLIWSSCLQTWQQSKTKLALDKKRSGLL